MSTSDPVLRLVIPGEAAGKKTSPNVIFPFAYQLGLTLGPGRRVQGLKDVFTWFALNCGASPARAASVARMCAEKMMPIVTPPATHSRWLKRAMKAAAKVKGPRPCVPAGHCVRVVTRVYLGRGQTGDLINFEQATWDFLQAAEFIENDFWINSHDGSERIWTDPDSPRVELEVYDLGPRVEYRPPFVKVDGLTAAKRSRLPLRFAILAPAGDLRVERCQVENGTSREALVRECDRIWRAIHGVPLPDGSRVSLETPGDVHQVPLALGDG